MIEREPNHEEEDYRVDLVVGGYEFHMPEQAASAWTYKDPKYDHIGLNIEMLPPDDDGVIYPRRMLFFFRELLGSDFDDAVEAMKGGDYRLHIGKGDPDKLDKQMYQLFCNNKGIIELILSDDMETYMVQPFDPENEREKASRTPGKELVHVQPEYPEDLPVYGATREKEIVRDAGRLAFLLEHIANGGKYA